jgi:hypothetical protein
MEGQSEMEDMFEKQQKEVTSTLEEPPHHLREGIEATRRKLEDHLETVDVRSQPAGDGSQRAQSTTF